MKKATLLIMLCCITVIARAYSFKADGFYFNITSAVAPYTVAVTYKAMFSTTPEYTGNMSIPGSVTYEGINYSVTSIGDYAFSDSYYLTSITIGSPVTTIGSGAFQSCYGLNSITIGNSVTTIESLAFNYCSYLTSITIPNSVTTIGDFAFQKCFSLESIFIPGTVTSIGIAPFSGCAKPINVDVNNANYSSLDGVLYNKAQTSLIECPTSKSGVFTIPSTVTMLNTYAFADCIQLTSIIIPGSVTAFGDAVFAFVTAFISVDDANPRYSGRDGVLYDKNYTTLIHFPTSFTGAFTIPSSVTAIGDDVPSITYTYVGSGAFAYCTGLTSITIPSSVTTIRNYSFSNCTGLTSIKTGCSTPPVLWSGVFSSVPVTTCKLIVPYGSLNAYKAAPQWKDFTNISESIGISTLNATAITGTTVTTGGRIDNDGGYPILSRGICWATTANPTTNNGIISNGTTGTGSYSLIIAGLAPNTTYHLRAYATNITGTYYGDDISFTTQISTAVKNNYFGNSNTYFNPGNRKIVFGPGDTSTTQFTLQLYNLAGRKIYSSELSGAEVELYLSSLQLKGIYLLQLLDNKGLIIVNQKIILNREQ